MPYLSSQASLFISHLSSRCTFNNSILNHTSVPARWTKRITFFPENAYKKGRAISDPAYIDFYFVDGFKDPTVKLLATFLRDLIAPQLLENLNERMIH
jgi:hypothetical protein